MHTYEHDSMAGKQEAGEKHTHGGRLVSLSSLDIVTQLLWYVATFVFSSSLLSWVLYGAPSRIWG